MEVLLLARKDGEPQLEEDGGLGEHGQEGEEEGGADLYVYGIYMYIILWCGVCVYIFWYMYIYLYYLVLGVCCVVGWGGGGGVVCVMYHLCIHLYIHICMRIYIRSYTSVYIPVRPR